MFLVLPIVLIMVIVMISSVIVNLVIKEIFVRFRSVQVNALETGCVIQKLPPSRGTPNTLKVVCVSRALLGKTAVSRCVIPVVQTGVRVSKKMATANVNARILTQGPPVKM